MVVDELARRHGGSFKGKFSGSLADVRLRRREARAAQARDVHERVGRVDPGRGGFYKLPLEQVLVVHDDVDLEVGTAAGAARRRARRPQRAAVDRGRGSAPATSSGCASASADPGRGDPRPVADYVLSHFSPRTTSRRSSAARPTRSRCSRSRASTRRSGASTERRPRARASGRRPLRTARQQPPRTQSRHRPRAHIRHTSATSVKHGTGGALGGRRRASAAGGLVRDGRGHCAEPGRPIGARAVRWPRRALPARTHGPDRSSQRSDRGSAGLVVELRRAASASRRSPQRSRRGRASRSPCCRCSSPPCTRSSAGGSSSSSPRTRTRGMPPRGRRGSSGRSASRSCPGRGVSLDSGLAPPPHLVGERYRALDVLAAGGLVCASAASLAEGLPPVDARPAAVELRIGDEPGVDGLAERARARRIRARRARRRARPVRRPRRDRRRLPLDRPRAAAGRVLRRRDRAGARVLALHAAGATPGRRGGRVPRRRAPSGTSPRSTLGADDERAAGRAHDLVPPVDRAPDLVWQPDDVRRVWEEEGLAPIAFDGATELDPFPRGAAPRVRGAAAGDRRARARRGGERARAASSGPGTASSSRSPIAARPSGRRSLLRKVEAPILEPGEQLPAEPELLGSRSRRRAAASSGASSGSSCCPTRRSSASGRRAPTRGSAGPSRASPTSGSATTSSTRTTASGSCSASRRRRSPASRATTSTSRSAARTGSTSRTSSSGSSRSTSAPTRPRRRSRSSAARHGRTSRRAPATSVRELAGDLLQLYAQRQRAEGVANDLSNDWLERLEASFPYRETDDQQRAIEAVKEDLESPRPMDRLVCGDVGFGKTEVAVRAAFAVAVNGRQVLVLCPTTILAEQHWNTFRERYRDFPIRVEMVSRFRRRPRSRRYSSSSPKARSTCSSARTGSCRAT